MLYKYIVLWTELCPNCYSWEHTPSVQEDKSCSCRTVESHYMNCDSDVPQTMSILWLEIWGHVATATWPAQPGDIRLRDRHASLKDTHSTACFPATSALTSASLLVVTLALNAPSPQPPTQVRVPTTHCPGRTAKPRIITPLVDCVMSTECHHLLPNEGRPTENEKFKES